jgi:hypothetical protein
MSNVAITFLGCLEFHNLNFNNSDPRASSDISGKYQNRKICCGGFLFPLSEAIKQFAREEKSEKLNTAVCSVPQKGTETLFVVQVTFTSQSIRFSLRISVK